MKKILKNSLILIIVFGIICSISSSSIAVEINTNLIQPRTVDDNEADDEYGINLINEDIPTEEENLDKKDNLSYFGTEDVTIDDEVYGDAFIFTSGKVTINSTVYGNVFVFATDLTVSKDGEIKSSLFSFSEKTNIIGTINTNIYAVSEDFTFDTDAKLSYDLFVSAKNLAINGVISRNAYCSTENLTMTEDGAIRGNISYTANEDAQIKREAVGGDISFTRNSNEIKEESTILDIILDIISYIILVLILYMIYKLLKAKFVTDSNLFVDNIGKCVLYGGIFLIGTPIIFTLTLLVGSIILPNILSGPAFILFVIMLLIYILLLLIACSTTIIALSIYIANKYKEKLKINDTLATVLIITLLALVYKLLVLVPTISLIITLVLMVLGLGIWVKLALPEKSSE